MYLGCAHVCVPLYFYSATLYMSSGCNSPCSWHKWYKCQAAWMKNHTETLVGNILHFLGWCFSMSPESPISLCQVQPNKTHLPSHKRWINTAKTSKTRCAVKSKPLMVRPSTRWKFLLHLPHLESRHYILWTCYLYLKASKVPLGFRIHHLNQLKLLANIVKPNRLSIFYAEYLGDCAMKMPRSASYGTHMVQIRQPWTHAWCCADHFPTKAFCPLSCCWAMLMALLAFARAMATGQPKVCVVNPHLVFSLSMNDERCPAESPTSIFFRVLRESIGTKSGVGQLSKGLSCDVAVAVSQLSDAQRYGPVWWLPTRNSSSLK